MYGFLTPYEARLRQQNLGPEWETDTRQRAHLILDDLQLTASQVATCPDMPPLGTWPQLLGAMYVVEGSTLGGQVIARQLAKSNIPMRSYFSGYAERTGPLWKVFCQLLTQEATPENEAEIVQQRPRAAAAARPAGRSARTMACPHGGGQAPRGAPRLRGGQAVVQAHYAPLRRAGVARV
uniref:Heme oxygenase n=1 Tax=Tanacetum cinerariifolium TaxID=118510 RepID=A0A699QJA8_TANCI|nr:hypothetical protein [Tanacetum cinerariifolium]